MNFHHKILKIALFSLLCACFKADAQSPVLSDSSLKETLTRAVLRWKEGKAKEAFFALDSINDQTILPTNAITKIKASVWTATYLMAQRKNKPASAFLDSALRWAENHGQTEEQIRIYETYADWHLAVGNPKTALIAKEAAWAIKDSIGKNKLQIQVDSLLSIVQAFEMEKKEVSQKSQMNDSIVVQKNESLNNWIYILSGVLAVLVVVIFMMNGNLQRLRNLPPGPLPDNTLTQPRNRAKAVVEAPATKEVTPIVESKTPVQEIPAKNEVKAEVSSQKAEKKELQISNTIKDTAAKLGAVELVLIKAEILAQSKNGESKPIRNLLNEYMAQLPFIMKTLDDAITLNEKETILNSLEHLKSYLVSFGMNSTLTLIEEIEKESENQKVAKLLSRVFQVRNHCRRAADEAKSLLEVRF